jgi:hypothetical protein
MILQQEQLLKLLALIFKSVIMKNLFLLLFIAISCKSFTQSACTQYTVIPLRTFTEIPENQCYYMKDINNELNDYEGTWKGNWNGKTFFITFKKIINKYDEAFRYNEDFLIGKFKLLDATGNILFDNTAIADNDAKIKGGKFAKIDDKYSLSYYDKDLCGKNGFGKISFANAAKTQLQWEYYYRDQTIFPSCFYYNYPANQRPEPLPAQNLILTKQ